MDPARKRKTRLVIALGMAMFLAVALVYTSFGSSEIAKSPSQLLAGADAARTYQLTGKVVEGSIKVDGTTRTFRVRDRDGTASVPVSYTGAVPDPFKDGREVIVNVRQQGAAFVGVPDSLITKCPSKFSDGEDADPAAPASGTRQT